MQHSSTHQMNEAQWKLEIVTEIQSLLCEVVTTKVPGNTEEADEYQTRVRRIRNLFVCLQQGRISPSWKQALPELTSAAIDY